MDRKALNSTSATSRAPSQGFSYLELMRKNQQLARENSVLRLKVRNLEQNPSPLVSLRMARTDIRALYDYINMEMRNKIHHQIDQEIDCLLTDFQESVHDLPNRLLADALEDISLESKHSHLSNEQRDQHRQSSFERIKMKFNGNGTNELETIAEMSRSRISDLQVTDQITQSRTTTITRTISIGSQSEANDENSQPEKLEKPSKPAKPAKPSKTNKAKKTSSDAPPRPLRQRKQINYKE